MPGTLTLEELKALNGKPLGTSSWFTMDQKRIDAFADVTQDWQYIHVDPVAAAKSPFGSTIAHGFLTLSMLSAMLLEMPAIEGMVMGVNYGFDKVRFLTPVPAGARIRAHFAIKSVDDSRPGEVTTIMGVSLEIEGKDKPALIAEWISRRYFGAKK